MDAQRTFRLRVKYAKAGRLAMLSHLELTHALERMIRRSDLPFALTQGFSPHMKLAFGSALPVGIGSSCEIFDLTLTRYVAPGKALDALKAACASDLMCKSCEYIEPSAKAASVAFPYSVYEAKFDCPIEDVCVPASIEVVRKKKTKTLIVRDFLIGEVCLTDDDSLRFQLKSSNEGSLRPDKLLEACEVVPAVCETVPATCEVVPAANLLSVERIAQSDESIGDILSLR